MEYMKIKDVSELPGIGSISVTGSCAAMMWSGHTLHAMLGAYILVLALCRAMPDRPLAQFMTRPLWRYGARGIVCAVAPVGLAEGLMIMMNSGHYTVDVLMAYLLFALVITNEQIEACCFRLNYFLLRDHRQLATDWRGGDQKATSAVPAASQALTRCVALLLTVVVALATAGYCAVESRQWVVYCVEVPATMVVTALLTWAMHAANLRMIQVRLRAQSEENEPLASRRGTMVY